jgi:integrase
VGRRPTGRVEVRRLRHGRIAYDMRVTWRGEPVQYLLGYSPEWNDQRADEERDRVVKLIDLDLWEGPPKREVNVPAPEVDPRMNIIISDWWARGISADGGRWAPNTVEAYRYQLPYLKWWKDHRGSQVDVHELDRWLAWLAQQRRPDGKPLSVSYKNAIIERLAQVLDFALRRGWVAINVARLPDTKFRRPHSEAERRFEYLNVDQLLALLAAARELDDGLYRRVSSRGKAYAPHPTSNNLGRVALLGLLFYAGLREHEAGNLTWQDALLEEGVLRIRTHGGRRSGKTRRGVREPNIVPALALILADWKGRTRYRKPTDFVCPTYKGGHRSNKNIDDRILRPCIHRANATGAALPAGITSHWGRRTFATNLADIGETAAYIQDQLGHEDARLAQEVYRQRQARRTHPDPRLFDLYGQPHHVRPAA